MVLMVAYTFAAEEASVKKKKEQPRAKKDISGDVREARNLEYSLTLPHSHVASFRALNRRVNTSPLDQNIKKQMGQFYTRTNPYRRSRPGLGAPAYAVQMEPMVQYSQKDPLYDAKADIFEDSLGRNEIHAQAKILSVRDDNIFVDNHVSETLYGAPQVSTAQHYGPPQHHYYEQPEPIIEIIIKESNESLPPLPQPVVPPPVKKEPVQVFYVKYKKDPHGYGKDSVIYEEPIPAITPPTNNEQEHNHYPTAVPTIIHLPSHSSTTLRTIIKPESEVYHSNSGVKVTFGTENHGSHHSVYSSNNDNDGYEGHEETAPRPAVAFPNQPRSQPLQHVPHFQKRTPPPIEQSHQGGGFQQGRQAQQRIQFQPHFQINQQELPIQNSPVLSFRPLPQSPRLTGPSGSPPFNGPPSFNGPLSTHNGPPLLQNNPTLLHNGPQPSHNGPPQSHNGPPPSFNGPQQPNGVKSPFVSGPLRGERPQIPFNGPSYAPFANGNFRPRPPSEPRRPFQQGPQTPNFQFDEAKYLQDNYHTISSDQVQPLKEQTLPNRPAQSFHQEGRPENRPLLNQAMSMSQEEYNQRYYNQLRQQQEQQNRNPKPALQLPQQGPPPQFLQSFNDFNTQNYRERPNPINQNSQPRPSPDQVTHSLSNHQQGFGPVSQKGQHLPASPGPQKNPSHSNQSPQQGPQQPLQQREPQQNIQQQNQQQFHQQNLAHIIPNGGELISSIPKFEQHIIVSGPELNPSQSPYSQQIQNPQGQNMHSHPHQSQGGFLTSNDFRQEIHQQFGSEQQANQHFQHIKNQQEEIERLQSQLLQTQQAQIQLNPTFDTSPLPHGGSSRNNNFQGQNQYSGQSQEERYLESFARSPQPHPQSNFSPNTVRPPLAPTTKTVDITPTTHRHASSTLNSVGGQTGSKKPESKKKQPSVILPDEVPDDLRQQLLSSGILDNADISVLDYDKIGDTPLDSLPPDQLANFFSAGGAQQIAASEFRPSVVKPNGDKVEPLILEDNQDQFPSASEMYTRFSGNFGKRENVEMKVVHFDPKTERGQDIADGYVKENATRLQPVALNDRKYNRYLPLKVSGDQFPLPDAPELKGRKVSSVVVLAPVDYESMESTSEHNRPERALEGDAKTIRFIAGDTLTQLVKNPSSENYKIWLEKESATAPEMQSVVLLVTGTEDENDSKEIFMYDIIAKTVSKLSGDLSATFVDVAENNANNGDLDGLAISENGTVDKVASPSEKRILKNHKPSYTDVKDKASQVKTKDKTNQQVKQKNKEITRKTQTPSINEQSLSEGQEFNQVSISSGYSRMKMGRSL